MARVKRNIITQGISGSLDRKITFKHYGDTTIITSFPDRSKVKLTKNQKKENSKFREAMAYAKRQMADPVAKAEYKARAKGLQKPHNVAIADFYNPPEIKHIDVTSFHGQKNDKITVHAVDDFKVVKVTLEIANSEGTLLEKGDAIQKNRLKWEYKIISEPGDCKEFKILAYAYDKPGNITNSETIIKLTNSI